MKNRYPTLVEYNQLFQKGNGSVFNKLNGIKLIPSRRSPIKVYLFGSGAFAAVFKGEFNGEIYAIRCFLDAQEETISRYRIICNYLHKIDSTWKTKCVFLEDELVINTDVFPIIKMEWLNGSLINQFVTKHLSNNYVLGNLQIKLIELSDDLERNKIGHGDIQCGNVIIVEEAEDFHIKLIDYDGMFVPDLIDSNSIEKGRSEFQHPRRSIEDFNHKVDRFSFWVIITALEALKIDKSLWLEVMNGGFNTLDNFLFTIHDFINPSQSDLFIRLYSLNSKELNYYLDKLKYFCNGEYSSIAKPMLFNSNSVESIDSTVQMQNNLLKDVIRNYNSVSVNSYKIVSNDSNAFVLTSSFQKLGKTPLELDKNKYGNKVLLISNGKEAKHITLDLNINVIEVNFD